MAPAGAGGDVAKRLFSRRLRSKLNGTDTPGMASGCRVSFVVTSRNDDHGGRMLSRFGVFAEALLEQANRHRLAGELIVVEWNPPPGPRLHEVLRLRTKSESFPVRFIEVPGEAHNTIRNSDTIPLFQMIAKNVGIRRARGEFVVATNPDVLFADALISFLAAGNLQADTMYRLDRHDVAADVPEGAGVAERLAWCERHVLRIHGQQGTVEPTVGWLWRRLRGCSPWPRRALRAEDPISPRTNHAARRTLYRRLRRAMTLASAVYGPRRVLRHALLLGLKKLLGPPPVHTNGCGDFTMLCRDRWFELRGYPELPLWSMHIDSFLCLMAVASGVRERVLRPPSVMFHMEHGQSWVVMTPESRLRTFALKPWIDTWLLGDLWEEAYETRRPVVFNDERWGLADWKFEEVLLLAGEKQVIEPGSLSERVREAR